MCPANSSLYVPLTSHLFLSFHPNTDIEDLMKKDKNGVVAMCRCWRSKTFPLCDGSHTEHNKKCGDNVGPLVLKK